jgi:DNA-binding YbaB/EbfC family protein
MGTGFAKKKKQARMMQDQLTKMQSTMQNVEITGSANGLVTITMNGEYEIKAVKIKPECVDPEDVEGLQDLIKSAFKDALDKIQAHSMQNMPKGMPGIPGMF